MVTGFKHIINLFRSMSDEDIIKACENADKKSNKKPKKERRK